MLRPDRPRAPAISRACRSGSRTPAHCGWPVSERKVVAWTRLIHDYLHGRTTLARVYVLIDARHGLKTADDAILDTLGRAAVSHEIVLTKCDQVGEAELAERIEALKAAMRKRPAAYPDLIATSARTGAGIELLRAAIARLLAERGR